MLPIKFAPGVQADLMALDAQLRAIAFAWMARLRREPLLGKPLQYRYGVPGAPRAVGQPAPHRLKAALAHVLRDRTAVEAKGKPPLKDGFGEEPTAATSVLTLGFAFGPSRRSSIPPAARPDRLASHAIRIPQATDYASGFLPTPPHDDAVALGLCRDHHLHEGLTPPSCRPCWVHDEGRARRPALLFLLI